ncbi:MAG: hypothetical protein IKC48_01905 [Clostridia bacterium]|nr:hypothetical protein [Clostridia bacterium]
MKISKVNEYSYSYAEYQITDGNNELRCVCNSVPLPYGLEPKAGMPVKKVYAFSYVELFIQKETQSSADAIIKTEEFGFQYKIIGTVLDIKLSLIKVFDFVISLEYSYPNGIDGFEDGDKVLVIVDRFDCELNV